MRLLPVEDDALRAQVAEMHGGRVCFAAGIDGQGLGVELVLPPVDDPQHGRAGAAVPCCRCRRFRPAQRQERLR